MTGMLLRRLVLAVLTLLATSVLVFAATEILPGDVAEAMLGQLATKESVEALRERLHLDRPAPERYARWLAHAVEGDFGKSLTSEVEVSQLLLPRLRNTLLLALYAAAVAVPLAMALGLFSAAWPYRWFDRLVSSATVFLVSMPEFVIAIILASFLAVEWKLFPAVIYRPQWDRIDRALLQMFLPMLTLVLALLAHMVRMTRATVIDTLSSPYVEMALLKGASKRRIILRHALPNAIGPILSVIALNMGYLFSGVVIVEVAFSYPGLGRLLIDAIFYRDIPVVQATTAIFCVAYVLLNAFADICLIVLNPRLRPQAG